MFATYNNNTHITLKLNTMETNWIILTLIFVCAIGLIFFLVKRNRKDKQDVIESLNAQDDLECDIEREKDSD